MQDNSDLRLMSELSRRRFIGALIASASVAGISLPLGSCRAQDGYDINRDAYLAAGEYYARCVFFDMETRDGGNAVMTVAWEVEGSNKVITTKTQLEEVKG